MKRFILMMGTAAVAACGQSSDNANRTAAVQPKKPKPAYCFFKDPETKGWKASRDKDGNIVVKGKAYRSDSRYQAVIGKTEVAAGKAIVWPTIQQNATGYGAEDNWWDVSAVIPNSAALDTVDVNCGAKTIAELKVSLPKT
jgi:hypothetical protein